jgi:hypothetical protein
MNIEPRYNSMYRIPALSVAILLTGTLLLVGCDSSGSNGGGGEAVETKTVTDLPADPPQNTSGGGRPQGTGRYTFFSLEDDEVVLSYSNTNRADSNSTTWDLGFQSINVLVNNGEGGPGNAAAYVAEERFQDVEQADTDKLSTSEAQDKELNTDWYNYNANGNNIVRPEPGRTIVVRTADGDQYAKIRMDSYYKGAPDDLSESDAPSRYYTFDYVISDDPSFE